MRTLIALVIASTALVAAPVPKELRNPAKTMVGKWVITGSVFWGREKPVHLGELWVYGADGSMTRSGHPASGRFEIRPDGVDVWFDVDPASDPWCARTEFEGDIMKVAYTTDRAVRPTDCRSIGERTVWTFQRVKE